MAPLTDNKGTALCQKVKDILAEGNAFVCMTRPAGRGSQRLTSSELRFVRL